MEQQLKRSLSTTVSIQCDIRATEAVDCNLCGASDYRALGDELGFEIRECRRCGLIYVSPQPTEAELARFYESFNADKAETGADRFRFAAFERHIARAVQKLRPTGGRLLEVGCGSGRLLVELSKQPWELHGLDVSPTAVREAQHVLPQGTFMVSSIEDAPIEPGTYDCIVMVAVFEHVKDPRAILERLCSWLAPGGLLVIQVPYLGPFLRLKRFVPMLPIYLEAPQHLFDYSPAALRRYYSEAGLTGIHFAITRPFASPNAIISAMIWAIKIPGLALHWLTRGQYLYPFSAGILALGSKPNDTPHG